ncbi:MAG TPA: thioredoxin [Candidatus Faecaligallichristensenella faecipullorum]|nr:thioredoxin [Candidatus Faecaligallichristensenella faecipullorum]
MSEYVKELNTQDVSEQNLKEAGTMFVDFWAPWCGPCRMVGPVVEQLAEEMAGKLSFGKINIDENADAAMRYGVVSIPTMILFKDGKEVERIVGARNKSYLSQAIERNL